ncbi:hypothetical protein [Micromonospora zhanjiangensis]|uniref:Lipoprotein n=1 Tax=Micromonospora zhanjiangensis TaxID=1522057 RepID=A0ABV8KQM2_9ACTN
MIGRRLRTAVVALPAVALLAGCPADTTDLDRDRVKAMLADPLVARDRKPHAEAGYLAGRTPVRNTVVADVIGIRSTDPATAARIESTKILNDLRGDGWVMYFAACVPPPPHGGTAKPGAAVTGGPSSGPSPEARWSLVPKARSEWWQYAAYGYKIVDGVSYFVRMDGVGRIDTHTTNVSVDLRMIAPHSTESVVDLFPDRPPAIPAGSGCLESATVPTGYQETGLRTLMNSNGPLPNGQPNLPGLR